MMNLMEEFQILFNLTKLDLLTLLIVEQIMSLPIDNINQQFSNLESSPDRFLNIDIVP